MADTITFNSRHNTATFTNEDPNKGPYLVKPNQPKKLTDLGFQFTDKVKNTPSTPPRKNSKRKTISTKTPEKKVIKLETNREAALQILTKPLLVRVDWDSWYFKNNSNDKKALLAILGCFKQMRLKVDTVLNKPNHPDIRSIKSLSQFRNSNEKSLNQIKELNLSDLDLTGLSAEVTIHLVAITHINLSKNKLRQVPNCLKDLSKKVKNVTLDLRNNPLGQLVDHNRRLLGKMELNGWTIILDQEQEKLYR